MAYPLNAPNSSIEASLTGQHLVEGGGGDINVLNLAG
jgi:hypothetical protein